ncbi:protein-L-isoaspartate(D-aspartate) O-methyltransferase [Sinobacterium caligoides]|nr:protein-L-isoaspartate(D-aspartate) O-methyltransferase [Sinobacterium caligoides]
MTSMRTRERLISRLQQRGIKDEAVLEVMRNTPRHIFLDEALAHRAYEDSALPIGHNQTLSQPYIVAKMTELLVADGRPNKVLEVGTGSGYQSAVLAQLVDEVYSVERIRPLQQKARQRTQALKLYNIRFRHADGGLGWSEHGPFDAILSAAAPETVPEELTNQLAVGGRLVMPVGGDAQQLILIKRTAEGLEQDIVEPVNFVPLLSGTVG